MVDRQRLEAQVQDIAEACLAGREIEDDLVELKAAWPDKPYKTARQIAAHANASRGSTILWVVGLDERRSLVHDVSGNEVSDWWSSVVKVFDGPHPGLEVLVVHIGDGQRVTALQFDTGSAPYVVKTDNDSGTEREVPWRAGNRTRSAYRHELLRSVVAEAHVPELELVQGSLSVRELRPDPYSSDTGQTHEIAGETAIYVSALEPAMLPQHRQTWCVSGGTLTNKELEVRINPPYRFGGYAPSGGRRREPVGHIEVLGSRGMYVHKPGEITVSMSAALTWKEAADLRFTPQLRMNIDLPVDRSPRSSRLELTLNLDPHSEEKDQPDSGRAYRVMALFEPSPNE